MNWGKSIVLAFVLFALFIGVLVVVCVRQEISLVSKNYYEEELDYQKQIERMNNTEHLVSKPVISVANGQLQILYHTSSELSEGELKLFRPSDLRFDKSFVLQSFANPVQRFDVAQLPKGMYRARMQWSAEGKEYFIEEIINL
ncbi:MAG TPA: FixH family protein [Cyclobacteriaceae bacterium]